MKVTGYGTIAPTGGIKKRSETTGAGNFSDLLAAAEAGDVSDISHTSDVTATAALSNLLALQEISEEEVQRRKLVQRGGKLLDVLEDLRHQLLIGTIPPHLLMDLGRQLSIQKQSITDLALMEIIDDIELRAAVELAKLQMALRKQSE